MPQTSAQAVHEPQGEAGEAPRHSTLRPAARRRRQPSSDAQGGRTLHKTIYPPVVGQALLMTARFRVALWDRALRSLRQTQERELLKIIHPSRDTAFGKVHDFGRIHTYDQYRAQVPLGDYDSFSPLIDRMRVGEKNLLVPERIKFFGNSSGSSNKGKPKFLPISERQIKQQRGSASDALYRYLAHVGEADFTGGFTLALLPPPTMRREGPSFITTNPSLQASRMPTYSKPCHLPEPEIRAIDDYNEKLERVADKYLDHDVRAVAGTTCWFSLLFDKLLDAARRRGRSASTVADIWPNLKVLLGGGVSAEPYLPVIRQRLGRDDFALVDTYNATEGGVYASSDFVSEAGMLMIPDRGVFFEFVPVEDIDAANPRRLPLWAVETGRNYAIHVTTPSGLYAYRLGDIVRFVSVDPHRIEFAGRLSGCLSTTQELTTHVEIQRAVEFALSRFGSTPVDYAAAADVGVDGSSRSRYVLFVEFEGSAPSDLQAFAGAFDEGLQRENRVYREHRDNNVAILPPEVSVLSPGAVGRFMQDIGNTSVQTKFPRIVDDERKAILRSYAVSAPMGS